jgi:hypothetical protein
MLSDGTTLQNISNATIKPKQDASKDPIAVTNACSTVGLKKGVMSNMIILEMM